ncbi:SusC/RagA family TonB-linked outer membrane protein [Saccharicrinis fermentans]|uniref:TonB-linked outer membrane protein, SusC/RagA family n=1 Tax=Saccharicrinis fermentans DSM 9555 = JCM 21142 TaxID=869213 RepID=W7Y990_9BACT|nr:SusC/RagA family TonB-linked outer membrane protein [Saccharicrinis fermentans]GAF04887.1 TonB-linked outer membrane protein, SusC/RagA family [Saccharicrinis fermentans DSM 9555 = JCM 21142]
MKYIQIRFILLTLVVWVPLLMVDAQVIVENEADSLNINKNPLVQVAYEKVSQNDLLGGVSFINMEELTKVNYNTYSLDNMQGYVAGFTGNSLWGMDGYLVMIDGVPRDASDVQPSEIENISFLKSASAVILYGSRAAKGVVYISTKRGRKEGLHISVRANTGWHVAKSYPKYLGSAEYMTLYNEALENDGLNAQYSQEDIYHYGSGINPYRYPNVDFYSSDYIRDAYNRTDVNTEITGGNERAKFYSNIGFYSMGDLVNFGEAKNNNINRLNVRGNIDLKLNENIKAYINTNATFYNARSANVTDGNDGDNVTDDYWTYATRLRPNRIAPLIPTSYIDTNDKVSWNFVNNSDNIIGDKYFLAGTQSDMTNVFADSYAAGHKKWTSRKFQFDTGLDFDLKNLLRGLSFQTQFAVDYSTSYVTSYDNTYAVYLPSWRDYNGRDYVELSQKVNTDKKSGNQNISNSYSMQTMLLSGCLNYQTKINERHSFDARLLASGWQQKESEEYHAIGNANLGLQLEYNYREKYYADFSAAVVHSAKLPVGNRDALSPSATIGWRISEESFMAHSSVVDNMVLSMSGSILHSDLDIEDYYLYTVSFDQAEGAYWGWLDGIAERSTNSKRGANDELTYVKRKELSAHLAASLWNKKVDINTSFFVISTDGGIIEPSTVYPSYFSTSYPQASFNSAIINYNQDKRIGFDVGVNYNKQIGEFDLSLGIAASYYSSEAKQRDEMNQWKYQNRKGKAIDGIWGLESLGLFQSQQEIENAPEQKFGGSLQPGDIKYADQNKDGIIDNQDQVFLGKGGWYGAPLTTGIHLTTKWKNVSLFALGTGSFGAYGMKNSAYYWISGNDKYSEVVRGRWSEDNKENATFPRLTTESGDNNFRNSDYWLYKSDYFNLAKVQITYNIPKSILNQIVFQQISTYVSGSNLLTISNEREVLEMSVGRAPQTRFYNFGIKAVF